MTVDVNKDYNDPILAEDDGTLRVKGWNSDGDCDILPDNLIGKTKFAIPGATVARSNAERAKDQHICVLEYGPDITGAIDSSDSLQAAFDAVPDEGGSVLFPIGRYKITKTINIKPKTRIVGCGSYSFNTTVATAFGSAIICDTNDIEMLKCDGETALVHNGPHMENMVLIGNGKANGCKGLTIRLCNRWSIVNCYFGKMQVGIEIDSGAEVVAGGDAAWGKIDQCVLKECTVGASSKDQTTGAGASFLVYGGDFECDTNVYVGNRSAQVRVIGTKMDTGIGVHVAGYGVSIIGNTLEGCTPAIKIEHVVGAHANSGYRVNCIGNTIIGRYGTENGIEIGTDCRYTNLIGNSFSNVANHVVNNGTFSYRVDSHTMHAEWETAGTGSNSYGFNGPSGLKVRGTGTNVGVVLLNSTATTGKQWTVRSMDDGRLNFNNTSDAISSMSIHPAGAIQGAEISADPSAPAANNGLIYFKDNGSGKTQLCVRFATGAVQVLATEP